MAAPHMEAAHRNNSWVEGPGAWTRHARGMGNTYRGHRKRRLSEAEDALHGAWQC